MEKRQPMRVIDGTMQPGEPFWRIVNSVKEEDPVELYFDGPISEYSWWGDEVTPQTFKDELYAKGAGKPVTMYVNSPGGEIIAASMIRTILQEYPGKITADITGLAASAATIVVTGADLIRMRESALFMIHDPSGFAMGTIDEIKSFLGVLQTVKDSIVDAYETKTNMDREKLAKMMTAETWMTAREAKENGFIDEIVTGSIKKANYSQVPVGFANCLSNYVNVPEALKALLSTPVQKNVPQNEPSEEERRLRDEVKFLKGV